jgi:hypothetical protein
VQVSAPDRIAACMPAMVASTTSDVLVDCAGIYRLPELL